jgi:hypothetical protein
MRSQRREGEWRRLHELATILFNRDGQSGVWNQILAAQELKRLKTRSKEAKILAKSAADHFASLSPSQVPRQLIDELRALEGC